MDPTTLCYLLRAYVYLPCPMIWYFTNSTNSYTLIPTLPTLPNLHPPSYHSFTHLHISPALFVSALFCVLVVFLYSWHKPLAYDHGNRLQMIVHLCLTAVYLDRLISDSGCVPVYVESHGIDKTTVALGGRAMLEPVVTAMKYAPIAIAALDLLRIDLFLRHLGTALASILKASKPLAVHRHTIKASKAAEKFFREAARRARRIDELHNTLLVAAHRASHSAKHIVTSQPARSDSSHTTKTQSNRQMTSATEMLVQAITRSIESARTTLPPQLGWDNIVEIET